MIDCKYCVRWQDMEDSSTGYCTIIERMTEDNFGCKWGEENYEFIRVPSIMVDDHRKLIGRSFIVNDRIISWETLKEIYNHLVTKLER